MCEGERKKEDEGSGVEREKGNIDPMESPDEGFSL